MKLLSEGEQSNKLRTIYTIMMLEKGFIANPSIYPTLAHQDDTIALYGQAIDEVFGKIAGLAKNKAIHEFLTTPEAHTGFARLS